MVALGEDVAHVYSSEMGLLNKLFMQWITMPNQRKIGVLRTFYTVFNPSFADVYLLPLPPLLFFFFPSSFPFTFPPHLPYPFTLPPLLTYFPSPLFPFSPPPLLPSSLSPFLLSIPLLFLYLLPPPLHPHHTHTYTKSQLQLLRYCTIYFCRL